MKQAKKKAYPKQHAVNQTARRRGELARARRVSTAGPFPGLQAFFRARLPEHVTKAMQPTAGSADC